jgi:hypothetical protein
LRQWNLGQVIEGDGFSGTLKNAGRSGKSLSKVNKSGKEDYPFSRGEK